MEMLNWLAGFLENDSTKIFYILGCILIANMIDFLLGWLNARLNPKVQFSSSKAIYGIARKMILFIILIFFVPVSLLVPQPIGTSALYVLFIGYLLSEINSILNHLKITDDDKDVSLFSDFIKTIFFKGSGKSEHDRD